MEEFKELNFTVKEILILIAYLILGNLIPFLFSEFI